MNNAAETADTIETINGIAYAIEHVAGRVFMATKIGKRGTKTAQHRPATKGPNGTWRLAAWVR